MTSVPSIETLPWEAGGPQEVKAWVCRVNARHQGVVEYDKVIAIRQEGGLYRDPSRLIVWGVQDTVIGNHALDEIWGAWIAWPYKTFRTSEGYAPMGPRYFLEFGFKQYEWTARNGAVMKRPRPVAENLFDLVRWFRHGSAHRDRYPIALGRLQWRRQRLVAC